MMRDLIINYKHQHSKVNKVTYSQKTLFLDEVLAMASTKSINPDDDASSKRKRFSRMSSKISSVSLNKSKKKAKQLDNMVKGK